MAESTYMLLDEAHKMVFYHVELSRTFYMTLDAVVTPSRWKRINFDRSVSPGSSSFTLVLLLLAFSHHNVQFVNDVFASTTYMF